MSNPVIPLTPNQQGQTARQVKAEGYVHRVLVAFDVFVNVICGGLPDETISSRSARASLAGKVWGIWMCRFLNLFEKDHGAKAMIGDTTRAEQLEKVE